MSNLVDFHSHLFSRPFFESLARAAQPDAGPEAVERKLELVCEQMGIQVPPARLTEHVAAWLTELDANGVSHMVTFASAPDEAETVAEAVRLADQRLTGFTVVDPRAPGAADFVARAHDDLGLAGIVLFPALHGYRVDDPDFAPLFRVLEERGTQAVVHCGLLSIPLRDRFGLPRPQDLTLGNPLYLVSVAERHRRARFIVPHMGAGLLRETLLLGRQCSNVLVDTSSSNGWIDTQVANLSLADAFERVLGVFGPERVLFGTDSSVFPRGWRRDVLLAQREALGSLGVAEADRDLVFGGNATRLLIGA